MHLAAIFHDSAHQLVNQITRFVLLHRGTLQHGKYRGERRGPTASQGQTIRTGVIIDCARASPAGMTGMSDEDWWLHLYVMLSRATTMEDMLLLRPPPREILEAGPPRNVKAALERFRKTIVDNRTVTEELARSLGFPLD